MLCPQTSQRLEIFARASELVATEALTRTRMLRVLQTQIEAYRAEIEKLFAQHPDHELVRSLPGASPKIASDDLFFEGGGPLPRFPHAFAAVRIDPCILWSSNAITESGGCASQ